jgi:hypothetical protein
MGGKNVEDRAFSLVGVSAEEHNEPAQHGVFAPPIFERPGRGSLSMYLLRTYAGRLASTCGALAENDDGGVRL